MIIKMKDNNQKPFSPSYELVPIGKALWNAKCVRCRKGNMFKPGMMSQKMHVRCPHCDLFYERHPGYFWVSMFVSYAMGVAEIVAFGIATFVLSGGSENVYLYLGVIISAIILLAPFNFRYSRVLHMYFLDPGLKYQPEFSGKMHKGAAILNNTN
jgi:DNA-directed RNA polymerase subunit RPC12/RpoP